MKSTKVKEPRNTVLIRVAKSIRDEVKVMSQRLNIRMSRIVDAALTSYLKLVDKRNKSNQLPK